MRAGFAGADMLIVAELLGRPKVHDACNKSFDFSSSFAWRLDGGPSPRRARVIEGAPPPVRG